MERTLARLGLALVVAWMAASCATGGDATAVGDDGGGGQSDGSPHADAAHDGAADSAHDAGVGDTAGDGDDGSATDGTADDVGDDVRGDDAGGSDADAGDAGDAGGDAGGGDAADASDGSSCDGGTVMLDIVPGPVFAFPPTPVNGSSQQTFTVDVVGSGTATNVSGSPSAPFKYAGGSYPGTGGTCGTTIAAPCTIVVEYDPTQLCGSQQTFSLSYDSCGTTQKASVQLAGSAAPGPNPTPCQSVSFLYVSPTGNNANAGTSANAPKQTIANAVAAAGNGTEIRIAQGTYAESVTLTGCIKLFGGYDSTFATRDPKTYVSTVQTGVANGGVLSFPSASAHIDGLTVINTDATGYALYYYQGESVISNDVLQGGSYGMYFFQHTCGAIHDNVVSGKDAGMYFWQSGVAIYANTVTSTTNGMTTWQNTGLYLTGNVVSGGTDGVQTWQNQAVLIDGNRIQGATYGVDGWQSTGVLYRNNYLYGGTGALSESSNSITVTGNDVASPGAGLTVGAGDYVVVDNIFFGVNGTGTGISASSDYPSSIENNLFVALPKFVGGKTTATTAAQVNALDGTALTTPKGTTLRADGNVDTSLTLAQILTSPGGADGKISTLGDNDWHLSTNDTTITQGGKDATLLTCGSHQQPRGCGSMTLDYDGKTRTVPYSIGAYVK